MNTLSRHLFNLLLVSASAALHAAEIPASPSPFVMDALCARDGSLWIATEGKGLWMLPPGGAAWQQMTACDSALPTQNYYALAQDAAGRIWAGSDNRGLGVWNGKVWKAYSRMEGMPGERVFSIAVSGNAVAAATNGGVALYREGEAGPWQFFNRAEGMADDACASLCFGEKGVLWAAYSCGGAGYLPAGAAEWKNVSAPWDFGGGARQPYAPEGKGLPGNLGNAILAAPGGSVFYACTCGLASAKRGGKDWSFLRGADSKAKNEGLYKPQIPAGQEEAAKKPGSLPEDYVTALYLDGDSLWLGFREKGVQRLRLRDMAPVDDKDAETFNADKDARHRWVRKFVRLSDGSLLSCWRAFVHPELLEPAKMPLSRRSGPLAWCNLAARPDAASYAALKSVWERRLLFWPADSLPAFDKAMLEAWDRVQDTYAYARSAEWRPHSPNVVPLSLQELKYAQWNRIPWRPYAKGSKLKPSLPIEELKRRAAGK